jgi:hypothetical protein
MMEFWVIRNHRSTTPILHHSNPSDASHFFYGYVILGLCFANMVVMRGVNGAFGVYYLALLEEFPGRAATALPSHPSIMSYMPSPRRSSVGPSIAWGRGC